MSTDGIKDAPTKKPSFAIAGAAMSVNTITINTNVFFIENPLSELTYENHT
jgi:hypothetical protein